MKCSSLWIKLCPYSSDSIEIMNTTVSPLGLLQVYTYEHKTRQETVSIVHDGTNTHFHPPALPGLRA